MNARLYIIMCFAALSTHGTGRSAELHVDFRHMAFDNVALKLVGTHAEQLVAPTERGLLIRIPLNEGVMEPIGIAPRDTIRGDFEITAQYELLRYDRPRDGFGVGVGIVVQFQTAAMDTVSIERNAVPAAGDSFTSASCRGGNTHERFSSKRVPARSRAGKLRLVRTSSTVRAYYDDGGNVFKLLREQEVGSEDATIVRFGADTGAKAHRVEVLLKHLAINADEFVVPTKTPVPSMASIDPAFLLVIIVDILVFAFAIWKLWPARPNTFTKEGVR